MIPTQQQQQLDQLNQSLDDLFRKLESYSHQQLSRQPDPATWSPLMVVKHMLLSEGYSLAYLKKKLSFDPQIKKAGLMSDFRSKFVNWYLGSSLKWKAPEAISDTALAGAYDLAELKTAWLRQRAELAQFLESLPPHRYEEQVYKHPFGGRLSIKGMLAFFRAHFERHRGQIFSRL